MRCAIQRSASGLIVRSFSETRYHEGNFSQAGAPDFSPRQPKPVGRCTAAMMRLFEMVGFRPNVTQEINQQQIILSMVAAGFGVSLAPRSTPGVSESKDVVYMDLVEPTPMVEFNIVWRHDDTSPVLHAFLDTVRQVSQAS